MAEFRNDRPDTSFKVSANERQVGGEHYKGADYQHWDWAHDCRLHGLPWAASKYVSRHRKKNGREDLEKAVHYIDKAEELGITGSIVTIRHTVFWRFALENQLTTAEAEAVFYIMEGAWSAARVAVLELATTVE
jgi:predicted Ser/Thr protein kinase